MSASIDKEDSTDSGGGARDVLAAWLEAHAAGECDTPTMQGGFLDVCRRNHEAPWDALALLDQYQRRGKLEPEVARVLKSEIAQMVFGTPTEAGAHARESAPPTQPSGWRAPKPPAAPPEIENEDDSESEEEEEEEAEPSVAPSRPRPLSSIPPRASNPPVQFPLRSAPARVPQTRAALRTLRVRYELQSILGRGTDGIVYRALDRNRQHLAESQRYVAIKILHADPPPSAEALIEYERRAHRAQSLVHPHLVRVLDFDHDADVHFLVMELLQGQALETLLERGGFATDRVLKIIADIGSALAHAHEHGVILGNLTPRKVIITPAGDAKVIDVGFPAHYDGSGTTRSEAHFVNRYTSAERVSGEPLTTSDDVYSLACIAYELLTGRHPYEGRSGAAARLHQLRPEPINLLPRPAWLALERALRWTRAERDLTASQLVTSLTSTESSAESDLAIRAPRREAQQTARSHKGIWLGAILLVLLAGVAAWLLLPAPERSEVTDRIEAVKDAVDPVPPAAQTVPPKPTDTARSLESGQLIPTQPAGSATGPSALEAITNGGPSAKGNGTAAAPAPAAPAASSVSNTNQPEASAAGNGVIGFPKDTYVVRESDVVVRIPVVRTRGTRGEVSFQWRIERNSAEPGTDFAAVGPGREYMAAGQSSTVLHIPLVSDSEREGTEMFLVHIDEVSGGARLGELTRAAVIVVDDD
ncbi:MAG TPA: protein kinase [Steroidobacteraceae bacterium]|nr:protein kinase [Steroidobacteraceae bacterium]